MLSLRPAGPMLLCGAIAIFLLLLCGPPPAAASPISPVQADPGSAIFQAKCAGCHTIGKGKLVGPELKDVTQRRTQAWLHSFIGDPSKMFAANDATALQLLAENNNVKMPSLGLAATDVDAVIAYLQQASAPAGAAPAAAAPPAGPPGDPASGQRLFTGEQRLANGGPPCLTCHTVSAIGALGGGALGPDLTHVSQRYGGSTGLTPVLTTIAFPTMAGPFAGHALTPTEVANLTAFFQQADAGQVPVAQVAPGSLTPNFWRLLAIGLAGGAVLTALALAFWSRQRQTMSARLRSATRRNVR